MLKCTCAERKLRADELVHPIYIGNYTSASASSIAIRRWLFSPARELALCAGSRLALSYFFHLVPAPVSCTSLMTSTACTPSYAMYAYVVHACALALLQLSLSSFFSPHSQYLHSSATLLVHVRSTSICIIASTASYIYIYIYIASLRTAE